MDEFEDSLETMERLRIKRRLMIDVSGIFELFSKKIGVYKVCKRPGMKYLRKSLKAVYKDFKKGLKQIDSKVPVYIELPLYKKEGENMYSKNSTLKDNSKKEKIVTVPTLRNNDKALKNSEGVDIL